MPSEIKPDPISSHSSTISIDNPVEDLVWLKTRDGSPTLWNNDIGESYRSLRGAFTESYWAFVRPALESALPQTPQKLMVGEFGLGLGTNWLIWNQFAIEAGLNFEYVAIEKNTAAFESGLERWKSEFPAFEILATKLGLKISQETYLKRLENPEIKIFESPEALAQSSLQFDLWFHDPFGADVNPEGYSLRTLSTLAPCWSPNVSGFSYACNRTFQESLKNINLAFRVVDFEERTAKRSRLEFGRAASSNAPSKT